MKKGIINLKYLLSYPYRNKTITSMPEVDHLRMGFKDQVHQNEQRNTRQSLIQMHLQNLQV